MRQLQSSRYNAAAISLSTTLSVVSILVLHTRAERKQAPKLLCAHGLDPLLCNIVISKTASSVFGLWYFSLKWLLVTARGLREELVKRGWLPAFRPITRLVSDSKISCLVKLQQSCRHKFGGLEVYPRVHAQESLTVKK